jgi:hypothetical protein
MKIEIIHPEVSILESPSSFRLEVEQRRFVIRPLDDEPFVSVHDLVIRIFGEFLPHTPLDKMGINCTVHFNVRDAELRDAIGRKLAPQEPWGDWGPLIGSGEGHKHGGMRSLTMEQRNPDDRPQGWIRAKIEPSVRLVGDRGVFMEINDHYETATSSETGASEMVDLLRDNFDKSVNRSFWIIDQIMRLEDELARS